MMREELVQKCLIAAGLLSTTSQKVYSSNPSKVSEWIELLRQHTKGYDDAITDLYEYDQSRIKR